MREGSNRSRFERAGLVFAALVFACSSASSPEPAPAPAQGSASEHASPSQSTKLWRHAGPPIVGLVGDVAYYWDAELGDAGGIVGLATDDGRLLTRREIAGNDINGIPRYWLPAPGGFLTGWHEPRQITESPEGRLLVGWRAPTGRWSDALLVEDMLITWDFDPRQAVAALSPASGEILWEAPLERTANGVELGFDGRSIFVIWQQYSATAPTPTVTIPQRVRALDPRTGQTRWSQDFQEHTGGIVVAGDTLVVAVDADLLFLDGATRSELRRVATGHAPQIYPGFASDASTVYVGLHDAVTAYEAATGELRWRAELELDGGPQLVIEGELLLVRARHELVALELETGTPAWRVSLGLGHYGLFTSDTAVVASSSGAAVGFALPARFEPERATIRGRLELRCVERERVWVAVGPERVRLQPDGSFEAEVELAGFVEVSAAAEDNLDEERKPYASPVEIVELVGAGAYRVAPMVLDRCE